MTWYRPAKARACGELADGCLKGFRHDRRMAVDRREMGATLPAEFLGIGIIGVTGRALDGHRGPLSLVA